MKSSDGGQGGGISSGNRQDRKGCEDASEALLKELVARLQQHSESLQRDIGRLQRALAEINSAIALSLERVERLRASTERLQAAFGMGSEQGEENKKKAVPERRSGAERRSGVDRRRARCEVSGLLRWIEGTSLDRRKVRDRRMSGERRNIEQTMENYDRLVPPMTARTVPSRSPAPRSGARGGDVISLAAFRKARKAAATEPCA